MKAKCKNPKCLHEWNTKSKMMKVSCPGCGGKIKLRDKVENKNAK